MQRLGITILDKWSRNGLLCACELIWRVWRSGIKITFQNGCKLILMLKCQLEFAKSIIYNNKKIVCFKNMDKKIFKKLEDKKALKMKIRISF